MLKTITQTEEEYVAKASKASRQRQRSTKKARKKRRKAKQIFPQPLESNLIMVLKQVEKRHWHCQRISFSRRIKQLLLNQNNNKAWHRCSVEMFAAKHVYKKSINWWMAARSPWIYCTLCFSTRGDISYSRLISLNCNKKRFFLQTN